MLYYLKYFDSICKGCNNEVNTHWKLIIPLLKPHTSNGTFIVQLEATASISEWKRRNKHYGVNDVFKFCWIVGMCVTIFLMLPKLYCYHSIWEKTNNLHNYTQWITITNLKSNSKYGVTLVNWMTSWAITGWTFPDYLPATFFKLIIKFPKSLTQRYLEKRQIIPLCNTPDLHKIIMTHLNLSFKPSF